MERQTNMTRPTDATTTPEAQQLAVDVRGMAQLLPFSVRSLRRMDSAGKLPRGFKLGGRKLWRTADLRSWAELGFPDRKVFEQKTAPGLA